MVVVLTEVVVGLLVGGLGGLVVVDDGSVVPVCSAPMLVPSLLDELLVGMTVDEIVGCDDTGEDVVAAREVEEAGYAEDEPVVAL